MNSHRKRIFKKRFKKSKLQIYSSERDADIFLDFAHSNKEWLRRGLAKCPWEKTNKYNIYVVSFCVLAYAYYLISVSHCILLKIYGFGSLY